MKSLTTPVLSLTLVTAIGFIAQTKADQVAQDSATALLESVQTARGLSNNSIKNPSNGNSTGNENTGGNNGGDNGNSGGETGGGSTTSAEEFFTAQVHDVIYPRCYSACHTSGGVAQAQGSRLIIEGPGATQISANFQAFSNYITNIADGETLLNKIANSNPLSPHGGARVYAEGSAEYEIIKTFTEFY